MKRIEKLAIVLIVLWVFTLIPNYVLKIILPRFLDAEAYGEFSLAENSLFLARSILEFGLHIGIAVWLFLQASYDKRLRWVWCLFALFFGLSAAILYLLMQILENMKQRDNGGH